jgi:hypothetical protein
MLAVRGRATLRATTLIAGWIVLLALAFTVAGPGGLGTLLTGAFMLEVAPSLWAANRTDHPTGVSLGTWLLSCRAGRSTAYTSSILA